MLARVVILRGISIWVILSSKKAQAKLFPRCSSPFFYHGSYYFPDSRNRFLVSKLSQCIFAIVPSKDQQAIVLLIVSAVQYPKAKNHDLFFCNSYQGPHLVKSIFLLSRPWLEFIYNYMLLLSTRHPISTGYKICRAVIFVAARQKSNGRWSPKPKIAWPLKKTLRAYCVSKGFVLRTRPVSDRAGFNIVVAIASKPSCVNQ